MSGKGSGGDDGAPRADGRAGDAFHGPTGVQHGSGNFQVNLHEHRTGIILTACAVALVCAVAVIAVRLGGDEGGGSAAPPTAIPGTGTGTGTDKGAAGTDQSVLVGRLVNDGSGLCLRAAGTGDDLVPVQDSCTGAAAGTWTLRAQDGGATRTLRDGLGGRCLTVTGSENSAPAVQRTCGPRADGQRWQLMWGSGDRSGHFVLRADGNSKCLMVQGPGAGRPAAQTSCGEQYADQWWHLVP
ncbi:RICIN domain-containing protein [Streptomyces sp. NPDC098789]|uniref:RICIN domain-containing protein n=1 Tax=Streptomyces sp. NPDC098789 TaxID=3366098 RepID=UPI003821EE5C